MEIVPRAFREIVVEQSYEDGSLHFRCKLTKLAFRLTEMDIVSGKYGRLPGKMPFNSFNWASWFRCQVLGTIYTVRKVKCESTRPSKKPAPG